MLKKLLTVVLCGISLNLHGAQSPEQGPPALSPAEPVFDRTRMAAGFRALESACFGCHSPDASRTDHVAPPMVAIKQHYVDKDTAFAQFRDELTGFVSDPSRENSRMPGAIERFGPMPTLGVDQALLDQAAYYIFHTPLESHSWFDEHHDDERRRYRESFSAALTSDADYLRHGHHIAMRTKSELGGNLKRALHTGGTVHAIGFCSERAVPIAKEMSEQLGASIWRVSDRPRNPDNTADEKALEYITRAKESLARGEKPKPGIQSLDGRMVAYYPIVTNDMCLQCHGTPGKEVAVETVAALKASYPKDRALGYGAGELRGIFVVSMGKE